MGISSSEQPKAIFGSESLLQALEVLSNPEAFKQRITDLAAAEERAKKAIETIGPIEDIQRARAEADQLLADAKTSRDMAGESAQRITEEAREDAEEILAAARAEAESLRAQMLSQLANVDRRSKELIEQQQLVTLKTEELNKLKVEMEGRIADAKLEKMQAQELQDALTAEREKLAAIMDQIGRAVAA